MLDRHTACRVLEPSKLDRAWMAMDHEPMVVVLTELGHHADVGSIEIALRTSRGRRAGERAPAAAMTGKAGGPGSSDRRDVANAFAIVAGSILFAIVWSLVDKADPRRHRELCGASR